MGALGITDLHNMFALVKFYKAAIHRGIKPILGAEVNVINNANFKYKIILLAKNNDGYKNICELITKSYQQNRILDIPYIHEDWLLSNVYSNVIALSGGYFGDIAYLILNNHDALSKAKLWANAFPNNYYLEVQKFGYSKADYLVSATVELANELSLPLVATHPIQFININDFEAHELRVCISRGEYLDDKNRVSSFYKNQYFVSSQHMLQEFGNIPSAIANSYEIAKRCNVRLNLGNYFLPNFATPGNIPLNEYLSISSYNGLDKRLKMLNIDNEDAIKLYNARLENEIETIIQMGFAGYFLIVADFINWAKDNDIPVGPGRGSGAGSLVAFCLGITDIDPIKYNLLFERFLNIERVSMPDFDIDFCQDRRDEVIQYVGKKYGFDAVAQIATFGTMSSKAVIKDVGRALGLSYGLCDMISKLILNTPVKSYSLLEAYNTFPELKEKIDGADDDLLRLWELSLQLEDTVRSVGKHAAGVLIAPTHLSEFCPLYVADGMQTSQLDKDDVEQIGLVKFDFLGLRNLTIIQEALRNIETQSGHKVTLSNWDFSDQNTYSLLQTGNTIGLFQLESSGMRRVLVNLVPDRFEDIVALLALYRPGPLGSGMVDDFIDRKHGRQKADCFHDDLRECLESTYGVIVYQEQVMQIAQIIGGYTLGSADLLRRAMGKKKPEEMAMHRHTFINGALSRGYNTSLAETLFELMEKFAEYGFNKSHSAAYAVVSYHTAYLKANYLSAFMAATLSSELDKTDALSTLVQECKNSGLTILGVDVNDSVHRFKAIDLHTIRYAMGAVKGVGENATNAIVENRQACGYFKSFVDFCRRTKPLITKKTIENLIKAGGFDSMHVNRATLLSNLNEVLDYLEHELDNINQGSLFDAMDDNDNEFILQMSPEWSLKELLMSEKQSLGYHFSASVFDEYKTIVRLLPIKPLNAFNIDNYTALELSNLDGTKRNKRPTITICGTIKRIGSKMLKNGNKIWFIGLEDDTGSLEFVLYGEDYINYKSLLKDDEFVCVKGELVYDSYRSALKINAKEILTIDELLPELISKVTITIDNSFDYKILLSTNTPLLTSDNSKLPELSIIYNNKYASCKITIGSQFKLITNHTNLLVLYNNTSCLELH